MGEICELALVDWGVTPEYINQSWTEELLSLLFEKRGQRIGRMLGKAISAREVVKVSDRELFRKAGVTPKEAKVRSKKETQ